MTVIAIGLLAALAVWFVGSGLLRFVGAGLVLATLLQWATDQAPPLPIALFGLASGVGLWLLGHWLFAFKHHVYAGAVAEHVFMMVPPACLDPTRDWAIPVAGAQERRQPS